MQIYSSLTPLYSRGYFALTSLGACTVAVYTGNLSSNSLRSIFPCGFRWTENRKSQLLKIVCDVSSDKPNVQNSLRRSFSVCTSVVLNSRAPRVGGVLGFIPSGREVHYVYHRQPGGQLQFNLLPFTDTARSSACAEGKPHVAVYTRNSTGRYRIDDCSV